MTEPESALNHKRQMHFALKGIRVSRIVVDHKQHHAIMLSNIMTACLCLSSVCAAAVWHIEYYAYYHSPINGRTEQSYVGAGAYVREEYIPSIVHSMHAWSSGLYFAHLLQQQHVIVISNINTADNAAQASLVLNNMMHLIRAKNGA